MNLLHRWLCSSPIWAWHARRTLVPWILDSFSLGEDVLEIGPGYGVTTRTLARRLARVIALESDAKLAQRLGSGIEGVQVVHGDGAVMPFDEASYSGVVCFTMLHHVPSPPLQDRLFAEAYRVLQPGGVFAGTDSRPSTLFHLIHLSDTLVVVDPGTLADRLSAAGFERVHIDKRRGSFRFCAHKPG
jgi:SAM-dependent methyltransferase